MAQEKALLIDIKRCIGCLSCETACKQLHGLNTVPEPTLSDTAFTVVETRGDKFVRKLCMHCEDPACASACPVGAIGKTPLGPVVYNADKCIGCRYCMLACPNQVPRYQWTKLAPFVKKCDMCSERVKAGKPTACAEACPVQATVFGNRDELINEAWGRIRSDSSYVPRIWGMEELGGCNVLFVSDVPFEKLGFKPSPTGNQAMPTLTSSALGDSPKVVIMGGTILSALYWVTQRRREVALAEAEEKAAISKIKEERS
ncbi:MAG: 4Fe-4S dicluster domain-containing protein [Candidatus Korobacteraceae bacterium]